MEQQTVYQPESDIPARSGETEASREAKTEDEFQVAFSFIKPDFVEKYDDIREVMEMNGLVIIYADKVKLDPEQVDEIYGESKGEHFYDRMRQFLTENEVYAMIIGGENLDVQQTLMDLKKKDGEDGEIRKKFGVKTWIPQDEIDLWNKQQHPNQDKITVHLTQTNVIHVPDTTDEAKKDIKLVFGDKLHGLKIRGNLPDELCDLVD